MKGDEACRWRRGKKASSISVNPWSMPVTIKEISFHRSLNNRSIKLLSLFPHLSGSILHANCPIHTARWLFTTIFEMGVHVSWYHHFYETFPRVGVILQHPQRMEGIFGTISHAIYVWHARSQTQRCEKFTSKFTDAHKRHRRATTMGLKAKKNFLFCKLDSVVKDKLETDNLVWKQNMLWHVLHPKSPLNRAGKWSTHIILHKCLICENKKHTKSFSFSCLLRHVSVCLKYIIVAPSRTEWNGKEPQKRPSAHRDAHNS